MLYTFGSGNGYQLVSPMIKQDEDVGPPMHIPAYTSSLLYDKKMGYYLKPMQNFEIPQKIYGSISKYASRIFMTYKLQDEGQTGVLLSGSSGSGKTLLSHILSTKARLERNMPTIVIGENSLEDITNFMLAIKNLPECVLLFDEFEKTFRRRYTQEKLLPLFDGAFTSKKFTILIVNDIYMVSDYLLNRPSRIRYSLEFKGLETDFIREYCQDNLNDTEETEKIVRIARTFSEFNFDMLQMLVKEMNTYSEPASEAIKLMNLRNLDDKEILYSINVEEIDSNISIIDKNNSNNVVFPKSCMRSDIATTTDLTLTVLFKDPVSQQSDEMMGSKPYQKKITIQNPKQNMIEGVESDGNLYYTYEDTENNVRFTFRKNRMGEDIGSEYENANMYK